jgi:putative membrane protein
MPLLANLVVALIGLLHVYFMILEMFLWDKPAGLRAFGHTREAAAASKVLAANQGLYNGFLAAGLFWGLKLETDGTGVKVYFLCCILIAGLYGAATASRKILFIQALPAAVGLAPGVCVMRTSITGPLSCTIGTVTNQKGNNHASDPTVAPALRQ